jgi:hypothetical protein
MRQVNREGSHRIRQTEAPRHPGLAVPDHHPSRVGTLDAIVRAVSTAQGIEKGSILRGL